MQIVNDSQDRSIVISDTKIPFGAYQAIYHKLTKKVERIDKNFEGAYCVDKNDIINLNEKIAQAILQYMVSGSRCEITHVLKKDSSCTFSSVDKFNLFNFNKREITNSINYQFDFLIVIPTEIDGVDDIAQRYKINVNMSLNEIDNDDYNAPFFLRGFKGKSGIDLVLEYSDYAVAQALEGVVSGWVSSLPKKKVGPIVEFFLKKEKFMVIYLDKITKILPILVGSYILYTRNYNLSKSLSLVLFCIAFSFIGELVVDKLVSMLYRIFNRLNPRLEINITAGDRDRTDEIKSDQIKYSSIGSLIFMGIIIAILVNLLSSWVYDKL